MAGEEEEEEEKKEEKEEEEEKEESGECRSPAALQFRKKRKTKNKIYSLKNIQFGISSRPGTEETPRVKAQQREGNVDVWGPCQPFPGPGAR